MQVVYNSRLGLGYLSVFDGRIRVERAPKYNFTIMVMPSDQALEEQLRDALRSQNLETLSLKNLRAQLELKFQVIVVDNDHKSLAI